MSMSNGAGRERAVALEYQDAAELPKVVASGVGAIAERMVAIAHDHGVPIHENSELAGLLSKLSIGSCISPESYRLMAEILCFLYYADARFRDQHSFLKNSLEK